MMNAMEVAIISREIIKPSNSPAIHLLKPCKLSFFDQLSPSTYTPFIFFYPANANACFNTTKISTQLKKSLSKTLNHLYFLSGRMKNNLFIHDYEQGVPCIEARVRSCMSDLLKHPQLDILNEFLPCQPYNIELDPESVAPLALQLNVFDCGGIALGLCVSHKIVDGGTLKVILDSWAATSRGSHDKVARLGNQIFEGSLRFPPLEFLSTDNISPVESSWPKEGRYKTRRFWFDTKAIAMLTAKARSERVENPTRADALSCFIWKSTIAASKVVSGADGQPYVLGTAMDIRRKAKPRLPNNSIGNLFLGTYPTLRSSDSDAELHDLVKLLREGYAETEKMKMLQSQSGHEGVMEYLNLVESIMNQNPVILGATSWLGLGFEKTDFGWGKPVWVGVLGRIGSFARNLAILKKANWCDGGIEAWITLDEKEMEFLENDPQFLEFASPNPSISAT